MKQVITFGVVSKNKPLIDRRHLLAKQKRINRQYAEKNNLEIVSEVYGYTNNGRVYDTDLIQNLGRLMIKKGVYSVVIASIDSVFSTNYDLDMVIQKFLWNKEELISVEEGVLTTGSLEDIISPSFVPDNRKAGV